MTDHNCQEGLDQCQFTSEITYTIKDKDGNEVEKTTYQNNIELTYAEAVAMKYLHFDGSKAGFIRARAAGGMVKALES